ncbi:lipoprotein [Lysobacter korlensis]|uniref:Lipoprotein n=1 Tax=Lysobacter korlensis TaxID=553636 RepID=A0ABV6RYT5_9GAMM
MTRPLALVAASLLVLGLAGCTPTGPVPTPATESATPDQPNESPSPEPTGPPAVADLQLTTEGLGTLQLGGALPAADDDTSMIVFDPEFCTDERTGTPAGIELGSNAAGLWIPAEQYRTEEGGGYVRAPFGVGIWDDAVQRIEIEDESLTTDGGITLGSTAADIAAAYETVELVPEGLVTLHVVNGTAGKLVFEVATEDESLPGYWEPDMLGTVVLARALAADEELFAAAGSGNVVNSCPA